MLFALDANVWLSERLLRSATGAAFLHALRRLGGRIVLPSSTREEVLSGVARFETETVDRINASYTKWRTFVGSTPKYSVPASGSFRTAAEERFATLGELLLPVELELRHFQSALERVNGHRPPAATREQFRDCLLWEVLLEQAVDKRALVSADKDFIEKGRGTGKLAAELEAECNGGIRLFGSLAEALLAVQSQAPAADYEGAIESITQSLLPVAREYEEAQAWILGDRVEANVKLFATEDPNETAAVFDLTFNGSRLYADDFARPAVIRFLGSCMIHPDGTVGELTMNRISLSDQSGAPLPGGVVCARSIGTQGLQYTVLAPLDQPPV